MTLFLIVVLLPLHFGSDMTRQLQQCERNLDQSEIDMRNYKKDIQAMTALHEAFESDKNHMQRTITNVRMENERLASLQEALHKDMESLLEELKAEVSSIEGHLYVSNNVFISAIHSTRNHPKNGWRKC